MVRSWSQIDAFSLSLQTVVGKEAVRAVHATAVNPGWVGNLGPTGFATGEHTRHLLRSAENAWR
jgi:hypothetical protein